MTEPQQHVLLCHRCGLELTPGEGNFYVVRITAVADPSPPIITEEDLQADLDRQIEKVLDEVRDISEADLMCQVYRRLTIHLCSRCYAEWIENPTG